MRLSVYDMEQIAHDLGIDTDEIIFRGRDPMVSVTTAMRVTSLSRGTIVNHLRAGILRGTQKTPGVNGSDWLVDPGSLADYLR